MVGVAMETMTDCHGNTIVVMETTICRHGNNRVTMKTGESLPSGPEPGHQRLCGGQEAGLKLVVRKSLDGEPCIAAHLQPLGRRQSQDGLHGVGVVVVAVGQEARLASVVRNHDVQQGATRPVGQDDGTCCHALYHTWRERERIALAVVRVSSG